MPKQTSLRLPDDVWLALEERTRQSDRTRSQLVVEALRVYLGLRDAGEIQTGYSADLESRLEDAIARIERLENAAQTTPAHPEASRQSIPKHPDASHARTDGETFTIAELCERYGWERSNAARSARANGWVKVGKSGRQTLWRRAEVNADTSRDL